MIEDQSALLTALDASAGRAQAAAAFPDSLDPRDVDDIATQVGNLYMHSKDRVMTRLLRETGVWEEAEMAFLRATLKPGHTFLDIGANIGYFTVFASELVGPTGRVIAVEPERRNLSLLRANLWRRRCSNATVLPIAAFAETGFVPLRRDEKNRGNHRVGLAGRATELVPCARLEDVLGDLHIDVVKVDAQGSDHDAIAGLARTPGSQTILSEFWFEGIEQRGLDPASVAHGYEQLGFELALLSEHGVAHPASRADVVDAARRSGVEYVNVVLHRDQRS